MIDKIRKTHQKKTEWGRTDNFDKSAKKAGKRIKIQTEDDDWQNEVRNVVNRICA